MTSAPLVMAAVAVAAAWQFHSLLLVALAVCIIATLLLAPVALRWVAAKANIVVGGCTVNLFDTTTQEQVDGQRRWCVSMRLGDVLHYVLWFEVPHPVTGRPQYPSPLGSDNDADAAALAALVGISTGKARKTRRFPIETWPERRRLLMTAVESVSVRLSPRLFLAGAASAIVIVVEAPRFHLPRSSSAIDAEQRLLYPDGYPNLLLPVYRMVMRLESLLKWAVPWLMQRCTIRLCNVEVHGIADIGQIKSPQETRQRHPTDDVLTASVKAVGSVIRSTRHFIQDQPTELLLSDHSLTAFIRTIRLSMHPVTAGAKTWTFTTDLEDLAVVRGQAECPAATAIRLYPSVASVSSIKTESTLSPVTTIINGPDVILEGKPVWLAEMFQCQYELPCRAKTVIGVPCSISPEFIASVVFTVKHLVLSTVPVEEPKSSDDPGGWDVQSLLRPWADLWWDDIGVGDLVSTITGSVVSGFVQGANNWDRPLETSSNLLLRW